MITYGLILLVIGIIVWAVGRSTGPPVVVTIGQAVSAIGAVLLIVGLILLVLRGGLPAVTAMAFLA